jgi:hypothetical protein
LAQYEQDHMMSEGKSLACGERILAFLKRTKAMKTIIAVAASALISVSIAFAEEPGPKVSRQDEVARTGASVMPFDLTRTKHFFDDTPSGGVETITADDKSDAQQIALIQSHLAVEAKRFGNGDFSDPAKIHGQDMPGLAELTRAGKKLQVRYEKLPAGASLTYASHDPTVAKAIHAWFAAQRSDHAAHSHMRQ